MPLKTCLYCGDTFEPIRSTRKYCGDNCKSKYHQLDKEIQSDSSSAMDMLIRLSAKAKKYPDKQEEIYPHVAELANKSIRLTKVIQREIIKHRAGN